jgi:hypothetical protein
MFPKVILGETLGQRTELSCEVRADGEAGTVVMDAFPTRCLIACKN